MCEDTFVSYRDYTYIYGCHCKSYCNLDIQQLNRAQILKATTVKESSFLNV